MSTGLECKFVEPEPGKWYYVLEDWGSPKGAFDWRDYATAYGPFATQDECSDHLGRNHANPGEHWVVPNTQFKTDETWARLFKNAKAPRPLATNGVFFPRRRK